MQYAHRLDLLAGPYTVIFSLDGKVFPYALVVPEQPSMGEIVQVSEHSDASRIQKPLAFGGRMFTVSGTGLSALVTLPSAGEVIWTLRQGLRVIAKSQSLASDVAVFDLPAHLEPDTYALEATFGGVSRSAQFVAGKTSDATNEPTVLSFNANLQPALRLSFLGHQWLLKNDIPAARRCLEASLASGVTKEAEVELARAEALAGEWDAGRTRVRKVLALQPNDFDALTVLAYIETKLQDYTVAAELYRRALAVQDSPALRMALAKLPPASMTN
jgi:hypothetical protein